MDSFNEMYIQNTLYAVISYAAATSAIAQLQDLSQTLRYLENRQNIEVPLPCDSFGNNQNCPGQPFLCCTEGSLCLLDIESQGQAEFQCF